jgi:large subunit ribosomal protein L31e
MVDEKKPELEREYIIPLRAKWTRVPRYKRVNKAIKTIKEFLVRHMKIRDRDLSKIKVDKYLNEAIWNKGIRKPPTKIRVRAVREGDIVRAELVEMPEKLKFKKARLEKREQKAMEVLSKKKVVEKPPEEKPKEEQTEETRPSVAKSEEEKQEEKEKVKAGEEATKQLEKAAAKKVKHTATEKSRMPKRQIRKTLAK